MAYIPSDTGRRLTLRRAASALALATMLLAGSGEVALAVETGAAGAQSFYDKARNYYDKEDFRAAIIELRNAIKADPNSVPARLLMADIYIRGNQGAPAQAEIEAARKVGASIDQTRLRLGKALFLQRQYEAAMVELDVAKAPAADRSETQEYRGLVELARGDLKQAETELKAAIELDVGNVSAYAALARLHASKGDAKEALAVVDGALAQAPDDAANLVVKGDLTRNIQGLQASLTYFDRAVEQAPNYLAARLERAATLLDLGRDEDALTDVGVVYKADPENPFAHYMTAVTRARKGDYAGANELMDRSKGALDGYMPALQFRGVVAYQLGQLEQARTYLAKVTETVPGSVVARRVYGATLLRLGNPQGAIDQIDPLIKAGQKDASVLALYGLALSQLGRHKEAMTYFENAVAANPDTAALRTQLAANQLALGDKQSATAQLESALELKPNSLEALVMLALVEMRSGDYEKALVYANQLVDKHKDQPLSYNMVGAAYFAQGKFDDAKRYFQLALKQDANYHEARRNLAQLYLATGKPDDARREYMRVLEAKRDDAATMVALANLAKQQNNSKEQIDWLNKAVGVAPRNLNIRLDLIAAYLATGDSQGAVSEALATERDFPENEKVVEAAGRAHASVGDYAKAARAFEHLVALQPAEIEPRLLLGRTYRAAKDISAARRSYRQAMELAGNHGEVLIDLVRLESDAGNFDAALGYAKALRQELPGTNTADMTTGNLYADAKEWAKARDYYLAARKISFDKPAAFGLFRVYSQLNDQARAISVLEDWLKEDADDKLTAVALAGAHMQAGHDDVALRLYEGVIEKNGDDPLVLNNMAYIYQKKGDKRMIDASRRAYELARESPEIADTYGWILVKSGDDKRLGLDLLQRAAGKLPDNPDIRYHMAYAFHVNGSDSRAREELAALLRAHEKFGEREAAEGLYRQLGGN